MEKSTEVTQHRLRTARAFNLHACLWKRRARRPLFNAPNSATRKRPFIKIGTIFDNYSPARAPNAPINLIQLQTAQIQWNKNTFKCHRRRVVCSAPQIIICSRTTRGVQRGAQRKIWHVFALPGACSVECKISRMSRTRQTCAEIFSAQQCSRMPYI